MLNTIITWVGSIGPILTLILNLKGYIWVILDSKRLNRILKCSNISCEITSKNYFCGIGLF